MPLLTTLSALSIAFVAALGLSVPLRKLAPRIGMVDHPGPRKKHLTPVRLLDGLATYCGVVLSILVSIGASAPAQMFRISAEASLVVIVGVLDDRGLLYHQIKLFVGMPVAALILLASGIHGQVFSPLWPSLAGRWADAALSVLCVIGTSTAFSILDHMDGLYAGIAVVATIFFLICAMFSGQVLVGSLATAVLGAAIGFLQWNFNPAKSLWAMAEPSSLAS